MSPQANANLAGLCLREGRAALKTGAPAGERPGAAAPPSSSPAQTGGCQGTGVAEPPHHRGGERQGGHCQHGKEKFPMNSNDFTRQLGCKLRMARLETRCSRGRRLRRSPAAAGRRTAWAATSPAGAGSRPNIRGAGRVLQRLPCRAAARHRDAAAVLSGPWKTVSVKLSPRPRPPRRHHQLSAGSGFGGLR